MSDSVTVQVVFEKPEPTDWIHVDDLKPGSIVRDSDRDDGFWYRYSEGWIFLPVDNSFELADCTWDSLPEAFKPYTLVRNGA